MKAHGSEVLPTLQVQVLGSVDALAGGRLVHFQCVCVAVIPTDGHIVPLVVIQSPVTFALDEVGPIPKVKDIVYVPVGQVECRRTTLKTPGSFSAQLEQKTHFEWSV